MIASYSQQLHWPQRSVERADTLWLDRGQKDNERLSLKEEMKRNYMQFSKFNLGFGRIVNVVTFRQNLFNTYLRGQPYINDFVI